MFRSFWGVINYFERLIDDFNCGFRLIILIYIYFRVRLSVFSNLGKWREIFVWEVPKSTTDFQGANVSMLRMYIMIDYKYNM